MPNWQDFRNMKDHFKWFFGFELRVQFDRWTYWEKFDYLAVFWVCLSFDEALLATGFIFAVHFFNTHFRVDRFPWIW